MAHSIFFIASEIIPATLICASTDIKICDIFAPSLTKKTSHNRQSDIRLTRKCEPFWKTSTVNLYEQHQNGDMLSIKKQNLAKANRDQEKLLTIILDQDNEKSDVLKARFSETNKRIIELKQEIAELEHQKNTMPKVGEIKS